MSGFWTDRSALIAASTDSFIAKAAIAGAER